MTYTVVDQAERAQALDPSHSFIVQAPAGSGKTELLTQRFLVLLAKVNNAPEEIIALTFTRKAASEMRDRIMTALHSAALNPEPDAAHEKHTWLLAQKVLARDNASNWQLRSNPNRLRIQTIDSLCAYLTKQLPIAATITSQAGITTAPAPFYQQAATDLLTQYAQIEPYQSSCKVLLAHLDNNQNSLIKLIANMLAKRDQWLPYLIGTNDLQGLKATLEHGFASVCVNLMTRVYDSLKALQLHAHLPLLLNQCAEYLATEEDHPLSSWIGRSTFPEPELTQLPAYQSLIDLLLTKNGQYRKSLTQKQGCPAPSSAKNPAEKALRKQHKDAMLAVLNELRAHHGLLSELQNLTLAPDTSYTPSQWAILEALWKILPIAAAHLLLLFNKARQVDFVAVAMDAQEALGTEDNPTELSLALDYKIQHILIDEFQDTSRSQFELIKKLTQGWQPQDGRTLFLVGDPMQSIYRFREADVGLFLQAKAQGVGQVTLTPLVLKVNFRTDSPLVDWFNDTFKHVFPEHSDLQLGAINYTPSSGFHASKKNHHVHLHTLNNLNHAQRATRTCQLIQKIKQETPKQSIAILVRARTHLVDIIEQLQQKNLPYCAVDIEPLIHKSVVMDLYSLTQALLNLENRLAWLSLLRSPMMGLSLSDLHTLANTEHTLIWQALSHYQYLPLSAQASTVLGKRYALLERARQHIHHLPLRTLIEELWIALGGPAAYTDENTVVDAQAFFTLLESCSTHASDLNLHHLEQRLTALFATPKSVDNNPIQIMTIHKSKGLEFDVVILPELARSNALRDTALLSWSEITTSDQQTHLLMSPIKAYADEQDSMGIFLQHRHKQKETFELGRLLYVAVTRAKHQLHLMMDVQSEDGELRTPKKGSMLNLLWPVIKSLCSSTKETASALDAKPALHASLSRLSNDWQPPFIIKDYRQECINTPKDIRALQIDCQPSVQQTQGTLLHWVLQTLCENHWQQRDVLDWSLEKQKWQFYLETQGTPAHQLKSILDFVEKCIQSILKDDRATWILNPNHLDSACELALLYQHKEGEAAQTLILDRTFIDDKGVRWIIDYKSAEPAEGEPLSDFLDRQQAQYFSQLSEYAHAMQHLDTAPIKLALYFPSCLAWREWDFVQESEHSAQAIPQE